jgi:hypothetical protein
MTTALWVATSGWRPAELLDSIPSACRGAVESAARVRIDADEALVQTRSWPAVGATHFLPSFAVHTAAPFSARLELSVRVGGDWSPWVGGVGLGPASFEPTPSAPGLEVDVDVFRASAPVEAARVRLRLRASDPATVLAAPWMVALSISPARAPSTSWAPTGGGVRLEVPARSQMEAPAAIASRICSPTCVAMLLDFWHRPVGLEPLAAEIFHPGVDLYGVWPAAIAAAGRRGLAGYLLRFPEWSAAQWCLAHGLPIVASIRYAAGELTGAAVAQTPGHLIVLTGWDGDEVLVNDPAAPTAASVPRRYRIDELQHIWLDRTAVGYVLFAPKTS